MKLYQIQYFCAVARSKSMTIAAKELGVSQSSLSKAISGLSSEVGVELLEHVGRGIILSRAGELFYREVSQLMTELDSAIARLRKDKKEDRLIIYFTAATFISGEICREFQSRYPEIPFTIMSGYVLEGCKEADFYIYASPDHKEGLDQVQIMEEELVLLIPHGHPLEEPFNFMIDLNDTRNYDYQCFSEEENMYKNLIDLCSEEGFTPKIHNYLEDSLMFFYGLETNSLITLINESTITPELESRFLVRRIRNPVCRRKVFLSYDENELTENGKIFKEFCIEYFKNKQKKLTEKKISAVEQQ